MNQYSVEYRPTTRLVCFVQKRGLSLHLNFLIPLKKIEAVDHDFGNEFFTPFGMLNLTHDQLNLAFTGSKVTADFMVDALENYWKKTVWQNPQLDALVLYARQWPKE